MRWYYLAFMMLLSIGCSEAPKANRESVKQTNSSEVAYATSQTSLLKPLLLTTKPAAVMSVTEAMLRKTGETVVVRGQLPPETVKPFNVALAAFIMMSPESLAKEEVKDELACDDAAT